MIALNICINLCIFFRTNAQWKGGWTVIYREHYFLQTLVSFHIVIAASWL